MTNGSDQIELSAGGIPISLAPFFQEYNFGQLDADRHQELVIERTLIYGNRPEIQWLFKHYGQALITKWIQQQGAARLSRRRFNLWQQLLNIREFEYPRHWRQTIWPY